MHTQAAGCTPLASGGTDSSVSSEMDQRPLHPPIRLCLLRPQFMHDTQAGDVQAVPSQDG